MIKFKGLKTLAFALSFTLLAPLAMKVNATESAPDIISKAGIVVDYETGEVIYDKNGTDKMYLASTTKLMTALLFAEHAKKTDQITYTATALAQPPFSMQSEHMLPYQKSFKVGDTLDGDTVMKELLLFSGNDTAYMVAEHVGGTSDNFVKMMNDKAAELGLTNTHFGNPNGLPDPATGKDVNVSTAYELAILTKVAYENEWIRETMAIDKVWVDLPQQVRVLVENRNSELGKNGNLGGKTGTTGDAGYCFAGVYERDGRKLIGVVLKCIGGNATLDKTRFQDLDAMMTYSYGAKPITAKATGEKVNSLELEYKLFGFFGPTKKITTEVTLSEDVKLYDNAINKNDLTITLNNETADAWKVASSKEIPLTVEVLDYKASIKGTCDLSIMTLLKENMLIYISIIVAVFVIVALIILIFKLIGNRNRRSRRRRRRY